MHSVRENIDCVAVGMIGRTNHRTLNGTFTSVGGPSAVGPRPSESKIALLLTEDWHGWIQSSIAVAPDRAGVPFVAVTRPWMLVALPEDRV